MNWSAFALTIWFSSKSVYFALNSYNSEFQFCVELLLQLDILTPEKVALNVFAETPGEECG